MKPLILASSSAYRQALLSRLGLEFTAHSPNINETPLANEAPDALALRLACDKAHALKLQHPKALIIGSDQVAWAGGEMLNKPGNFANALAQLQRSRGASVVFYTGLCLYDSASNTEQRAVETYRATFRKLTDTQLSNYLKRERPYDCAGSFKSEGLGITLLESLAGDDPNSLIGLPLIRLTSMLHQAGLDPLARA